MSRSSKKRKRSCTAGDGGLGLGTSEPPNGAPSSGVTFQENDFICPVCFDTLKEVHVTICGHSFCYDCITESLAGAPVCPVCKATLPLQNPIHPNVSMNDLVAKFSNQTVTTPTEEDGAAVALSGLDSISDAQFEAFCRAVEQSKEKRMKDTQSAQENLMSVFLEEGRRQKTRELETLSQQLDIINKDLATLSVSGPGTDETQRSIMMSSFPELVDSYLNTRMPPLTDPDSTGDVLNEFGKDLYRFTKFSSVQELASLQYSDTSSSSSCAIVSSLEFDCDCEMFAVAGVTKRIKIYSLRRVLQNTGFQNHFPVKEMVSNAKLSSVHFNPYLKTILVSSDYAGAVNIWDVNDGSKVTTHLEHGKRVWSVMFNPTEPQLFASGSDDGTVKLWVNNRQHSIHTLDTKANVCCVRFHPTNRYHLAYGSADHSVHYVDLRNPGQELFELKGHKKAVSYVQFMSDNELVSASTDSELTLWDTNTGQFSRTYKGHVNEKNFVGLSTCRDFISCGSENNCLYVYGKHVSKPMLSFKFRPPSGPLPDTSSESSGDEFVSAVCWKKESGVLLAANSQGIIKVLQMC